MRAPRRLYEPRTDARADHHGAHYEASRFGAEAAVDARMLDITSWLSAHAQLAAQVTYLQASGRYCYDGDTGNGRDCAEDGSAPFSYAKLSGVFPASTASVAVDAHVAGSVFHHARLAIMIAAGWMPRLVFGDQRSGAPYVTGGLSLTIAFGAAGE